MSKSKITSLHAYEILDSRGNPTLLVEVTSGEEKGFAMVPSGSSCGQKEAVELRDGDPQRYHRKGVLKACEQINGLLNKKLQGQNIFHQQKIDQIMIELDGTKTKSNLGANTILGVSLAICRTACQLLELPLYRYLGGLLRPLLPCPMINIINGGLHADNNLNFQEFMIRPIGAKTFTEALEWGVEVFFQLKNILKSKNLSTSVGDEGGFAPNLSSNEQALDLIMEAIQKAGRKPKEEITIALDCASSEFYQNGKYLGKSSEEQVEFLIDLCSCYPIDSIEDGLDEEDWPGWQLLTKTLGKKIQIVGDDLLVTNPEYVIKAIREKACNSVLIKLNQIGTLTETIDCIHLAQAHSLTTIISHRSGETEDTFISDLSVAFGTGQIKAGSLCRSERIAKYNRLLAIEKELEGVALYRDSNNAQRRLD